VLAATDAVPLVPGGKSTVTVPPASGGREAIQPSRFAANHDGNSDTFQNRSFGDRPVRLKRTTPNSIDMRPEHQRDQRSAARSRHHF
jgi:hypothetical protein